MNVIANATGRLKDGWCTGSYRKELPEGTSFCGIGALIAAMHEINHTTSISKIESSPEAKVIAQVILDNYRDELVAYAESVYGAPNTAREWAEGVITIDNPSLVIVSFNDYVAKSSDEVVAVFEKAAVKWDERITE